MKLLVSFEAKTTGSEQMALITLSTCAVSTEMDFYVRWSLIKDLANLNIKDAPCIADLDVSFIYLSLFNLGHNIAGHLNAWASTQWLLIHLEKLKITECRRSPTNKYHSLRINSESTLRIWNCYCLHLIPRTWSNQEVRKENFYDLLYSVLSFFSMWHQSRIQRFYRVGALAQMLGNFKLDKFLKIDSVLQWR